MCIRVAPAELEAILLSHPTILDAAVIPYVILHPSLSPSNKNRNLVFIKRKISKFCRLEDEEAGQIQIAYAVKAAGSELTEDQVIQFVADQVLCHVPVTLPLSFFGSHW